MEQKQRWRRNKWNWRKFSAWNVTKVRSKKDVIDAANTSGGTVHFASLMDICHLKNAEVEAKHQKNQGRVVLRGFYCKRRFRVLRSIHWTRIISISNDSGENHRCLLQIARLRWTSTRSSIRSFKFKLKMLTNHWKFRNRCVQTFGFVYHDTKWPQSWSRARSGRSSWKDSVRSPCGRDCFGKGNLRKSYWNMAVRKIQNWECLFVHRGNGLFLSVYADDIKMVGKRHNIDPMWKALKEVDLGEPTSFLDHVYLGCTQRQCEISKEIFDNYRTMFVSCFSAGGRRQTAIPSKSSYFFNGLSIWRALQRNVWCDIVLSQKD